MRGVENLPRVHDPVRVEGPFDLTEVLDKFRAKHLFGPEPAHDPVPVLARHRAAELQQKIGHLGADLVEPIHTLTGLDIDQRPDVHAADRSVAVVPGLGPGISDDLVETAHVLRQPGRVDRRVFNKRERFGAALDVVHESEAVLTHRPHLGLLGGGLKAGDREAKLLARHVLFKLV